jgi:hypothetical protein
MFKNPRLTHPGPAALTGVVAFLRLQPAEEEEEAPFDSGRRAVLGRIEVGEDKRRR